MASNIYYRQFSGQPQFDYQAYWANSGLPPEGTIVGVWNNEGKPALFCGTGGGHTLVGPMDPAAIGADVFPPLGEFPLIPQEIGLVVASYMQEFLNAQIDCGPVAFRDPPEYAATYSADWTDLCTAGHLSVMPQQSGNAKFTMCKASNGTFTYNVVVTLRHYFPTPDFTGAKAEVWECTPTGYTMTSTSDFPLAWETVVSFLSPTCPDHTNLDGFWLLDLPDPCYTWQFEFPPNAAVEDSPGVMAPMPSNPISTIPLSSISILTNTNAVMQIQQGGVVPPGPSPVVGFIYSADQFPGPQVSFPPFNTRIPFQNYARAVPAVFIKRK